MKKFLVLAASAIVGVGVCCADTTATDLLIWSINLRGNSEVANKPFTTISQFYLQSQDGSKTFDIADYTYTDQTLTTLISDGFTNADNLGPAARRGVTNNYFTDWTSLQSDILAYTGEDSVSSGAWEFFMQLDNNGNMTAWSEHLYDPANDQASAVYLSSVIPDYVYKANMFNPDTMSSFNFGSHLVPEPTSGLLMMLGAGLLALRRRRRA